MLNMPRLIKAYEIEEFSEIKNIPISTITEQIIINIKNLDEKTELEKYIREIIYDYNHTPHGPTEIADIVTSHINHNGKRKLTAFVLKGKSFISVNSIKVSHQFLKLHTIPNLELIILGAVGNIQDDAKRDFVQTAIDINCDYLILDATDIAGLLIAYEKICPTDGYVYNKLGECPNGHIKDPVTKIEMNIKEDNKYQIYTQRDISHTGAKRYSAILLVDKHYPSDLIRSIITDANHYLISSNYYRNEEIEKIWKEEKTHVIWIYVAFDISDIQNTNWVCRTQWISDNLNAEMRPAPMNSEEVINRIEIEWNANYKQLKSFFDEHSGSKEQYLKKNTLLLKECLRLTHKAVNLFNNYESNEIPLDQFTSEIRILESKYLSVYHDSSDLINAPPDCKDYDQVCQNIYSIAYNIFLYYSENSESTWLEKNKKWLMKRSINEFAKEIEKLKYEEEKMHSA